MTDADRERDWPTAAETDRFAADAAAAFVATVFFPLATEPLPEGVRRPLDPAVPSLMAGFALDFAAAALALGFGVGLAFCTG